MNVEFSPHAELRIKERDLSKSFVVEALFSADKVESTRLNRSRFLAKKIYFNEKLNKEHLLIIVFEKQATFIRVVTIIDTSKIKKYY